LWTFVCSQSGNQPSEDVKKVAIIHRRILAKSGHKPKIRYKSLSYIFGYTMKTKYMNLTIFISFFPSLLASVKKKENSDIASLTSISRLI
jgi:hypothetical protein